jgi:thiamine biosynthesis lipoprotein
MATGAAGLGLAAWLLPCGRPLQSLRRTGRALGTKVEIVVLHEDLDRARQAVESAFAAIDQVEEVMSLYRPHSQLCRLNREGVLDDPHPDLVRVLSAAREISEISGGAFDVTVQPLWDLYARAAEPSPAEIEAVRGRVDWRKLEISSARLRLQPGMAVTLNGIAQGFATDRAMSALRERGIERALINAGELGSLGRKENGEPWRAGIQHPRRPDAYLELAELDGRCMSTSGDYATPSHIFEPATGRVAREFASVTVVARTGVEADALSTAVFVAGPDRGMELIRRMPGADGLLVSRDGLVISTDGFPRVS